MENWMGEYNKTWGDYVSQAVVGLFLATISFISLAVLLLTGIGKAFILGVVLSLIIGRE